MAITKTDNLGALEYLRVRGRFHRNTVIYKDKHMQHAGCLTCVRRMLKGAPGITEHTQLIDT
jgi:hypothetical protein